MSKLKDRPLAEQLAVLWIGFDTAAKQVKMARKQLIRYSKDYKAS